MSYSSISADLKKTYKRVDFSLIPHNDDVQWLEKERETPEALVGRIRDFLDWLKSRKEVRDTARGMSAIAYLTQRRRRSPSWDTAAGSRR